MKPKFFRLCVSQKKAVFQLVPRIEGKFKVFCAQYDCFFDKLLEERGSEVGVLGFLSPSKSEKRTKFVTMNSMLACSTREKRSRTTHKEPGKQRERDIDTDS